MAGRWIGVFAAWVGVCAVRRSTSPEEGLGAIQSLLEKHAGKSTVALDALQTVLSLQHGQTLGPMTPGMQTALQDLLDKMQRELLDLYPIGHNQTQLVIDASVEDVKSWVNHTVTLKGIADVKDAIWYECVEQARKDMENVIVQQRRYNQLTHDGQIPCAQETANHGTSLGNSTATDIPQVVLDWLVANQFASEPNCNQATAVQAAQLGMVTLSQSHWVTQNLKCCADNTARKAAMCRAGVAGQDLCKAWYTITQLPAQLTEYHVSAADVQQQYSITQMIKCLLTHLRHSNYTEQTMEACQDSIDPIQFELDWHDSSLQDAIALAQVHGFTCTASDGLTADKEVIFEGRYWSTEPNDFEPQTYTGAVPSSEEQVLGSYSSVENYKLLFTPYSVHGDPFTVCE